MSRSRLLVVGALVGVSVVAVILVAGGGGDRRSVTAEFENVRGLLEGNDVRVNGAPAGSVKRIELTERGTARVSFELNPGIPAPRADATAAVRPVDLLGDIYLSLSTGSSRRPLEGPIPVARTTNVARLADVLRAFRPGARAGLQAMLTEVGIGLERRGVDLNRAAVELRPLLVASDGVMEELSSQTANLRALVADSQPLAEELANRNRDVDGMIRAFAETLRTTARHRGALDAGLARLPSTLSQLDETTGRLRVTAQAMRPLAVQLGRAAPGLATAMRDLPPFLRRATAAVRTTRPTLRSARRFLSAGRGTFSRLTGGLEALRGAVPELDSFTDTLVPLTPLTSDALFDKVASQTQEPGDQPLDPDTDPLRRYWRGAAVLSCESFGLAIRPGCLEDVLAASKSAKRESPARGSSPPAAPKRAAAPGESPSADGGESGPTPKRAPSSNGLAELLSGVDPRLGSDAERLLGLLPGLGDEGSQQSDPSQAEPLLDFLLGG